MHSICIIFFSNKLNVYPETCYLLITVAHTLFWNTKKFLCSAKKSGLKSILSVFYEVENGDWLIKGTNFVAIFLLKLQIIYLSFSFAKTSFSSFWHSLPRKLYWTVLNSLLKQVYLFHSLSMKYHVFFYLSKFTKYDLYNFKIPSIFCFFQFTMYVTSFSVFHIEATVSIGLKNVLRMVTSILQN